MRNNFKEIKEDVLRYYEELLDIVNRCQYPKDDTLLKGLANQAKNIKEDKFCLLVAGEAKSGKSTFINAYLETEILPMDVMQCTSSVIEIAYNEEFFLNATYADNRVVKIEGKDEIIEFLKKNAAIDDNYRDIPVTIINDEIIIKYRNKKISNKIINDLLDGVRNENIHRLPEEEYNNKIKSYIKEKQAHWKDLVVKIDIFYPFKDEKMRGIRIIDSPGVNAAGKVGDVTARYVESADAIMFLRPITGVAIEANSFKEFLESKSVDRNKNAMFLVLTRTGTESINTIARAYEEFVNMFGVMSIDTRHGIIKEQIIPVDSKAELYFNQFRDMGTPEIDKYIAKLQEEQKLEPFIELAWLRSFKDKENFQIELKKISNFDVIDQSLNKFGRNAQYVLLSEFLGKMVKMYEKVTLSLKDKIKYYSLKVQNPQKLKVKISEIKDELMNIDNRLNESCDDILEKYSMTETGCIAQEAEKEIAEFREEIKKLDDSDEKSIDSLEKLAFRKIDKFVEYESRIQKDVEAECNEQLKIIINDTNKIEFITLEPDFNSDIINKIKEEVKKDSYEAYTYTTGKTFEKVKEGSRFSQTKYYDLFSKAVMEKLDGIKKQVIRDLCSFVSNTINVYSQELSKNREQKQKELDKIQEDKKESDELMVLINTFREELGSVESHQNSVESLKGGIDRNCIIEN